MTVTAQDRDPYIDALNEADEGDLAPFVKFVGDMQRNSVAHVLSAADLSPVAEPAGVDF